MSKEGVFPRLVEFVVEQSAVNDVEISRETSLADDLGVYGDDATEFIIAYGKMFNVDVSKFMAADYFRSEGSIALPSFIKKLFGGGKTYNS